ncbi:MAG: glutathione-disulfide reductase [Chlorogloeopsis fritschii C42_A2020_084]|uniref:glutathione-disulfide reductase n=1 Tax=Chlorogloeopsis fritschii TaxID=1124 RepID=UPI0019E77A2A|nr:glutathione-disulfide reductase [Chlorogloeopsis fritschii]MBF2004480.1 glutathione-disulfide reductase [Chlorogloeopsis fritschii C42_A2020_084]
MSFDYDLFVIGAGPGGLAASERAANYGARVAIAEQDQVGGTCVVHGCIPEKMMIYAASFSQIFRNADEYGWGKVQKNFDWCQFIAARNREINHLSKVHTQHLQKAGVELLKGHVQLLDAHTLEIEGRQITANKILIAVGGKDVKPNIPGVEYAISTLEMLQLKQQPEHLAIIGSNHIAVKLAGIMNGLISKVTQIVTEDKILPGCDEDIRTTIQEEMTRLGIRNCCNSSVEKIEQAQNCLNLIVSGDSEPVTVETVVFITDRVPNLDRLDLENAGVKVDEGGVVVDEYSRTSVANIFAVGDCTPRPHWTPVAIAAGCAFADTEFGKHPHTVSYETIPHVLASQPEAATVGLTEAQARAQFGESVRCYSKKFQPLFNLIGESEQQTLIKLVVAGNSERVLGAHMVGNYAAEVIQMIGLAMKAGVTKQHFDRTIGIHPTVGEEFFSLR